MNLNWLRRFDPRGEPRPIWGAEDRAPETLTTEDIELGGQVELLRWLDKQEEQ